MASRIWQGLAAGIMLVASAPAIARQPSRVINLRAMDHVGINVSDLQQSADWYRRVLGFRLFHKWKTTWMIERSGMKIGLFLRPDAKKIDDIDNTRAITHFAYSLDRPSFNRALVLLKEWKISFDGPEETGIATSVFLSDPDGYQVELTTYHR